MIKLALAACGLAIGLVVLFGLFLFVKGLRNVQQAVASEKWPTTPGLVVSSETTRDVSPETRKSRASVTFDTKTVIRYAVSGREYTTDILHFGQTLGSGDKSDAALQRLRYPAGKEVTVSYNPANPATAVMKPGLHGAAFWLPGAGLAFLLPAVLCLFLGPTMMRTLTPKDDAFAESVKKAIEDAQRGIPPDRNIPPPPDMGGDVVMAVVAAGFGAVACCLGILALTAGMQRIWHGTASQSWPTVSGQVIVSASDEPDDTTDAAAASRFVYQYEVAGTKHFNNLRRFAQVDDGNAPPTGAKVKVFYFPTDPDIAVLEPGNPSAALWLPGIGVVLILFALAIFIWIVPAVAK
jgi:hypothetical protein